MRINVVAHVNAKKPRIERDLTGTFHIWVNAPPLEGKANWAIIEFLANFFKTKKNRIYLIKGEKSKNKIFEVN